MDLLRTVIHFSVFHAFPCIFHHFPRDFYLPSFCFRTLDLDVLRPSLPTWLELPGTGRRMTIFWRTKWAKSIYVWKRIYKICMYIYYIHDLMIIENESCIFDILWHLATRALTCVCRWDKQRQTTFHRWTVSKTFWNMWSLKTHPTGSFRVSGFVSVWLPFTSCNSNLLKSYQDILRT